MGFRVQWDMPKSAPLGSVDSFVREAKLMEGAQPTTVGYGITSDPIRDLSYDSLFAAVYISIKEETGSVTYNKCDASGRPGDVERVLAVHTPLRLEFYERSAGSGLRVDWKAPIGVARDTFSNIVQLARKVESSSSDVVGYGLASKPITGMSQDALWKGMLYAMRNPAECGLKVDGVSVRDMTGYMQRTMRILDKPGSPTVTDNIRVVESAQEITYRPVANGVESEEERVFALRTEPLRLEMFCRHSRDEMRLDWQAPRSLCIPVFDATVSAGQRM